MNTSRPTDRKCETVPDLLFLDTETLGLSPYAPIWELAALRRSEATGEETTLHLFVEHTDADRWMVSLPEQFRADYLNRYDADAAVPIQEAVDTLMEFAKGRPLLIGSNPGFDTERIRRQWLEPRGAREPWYYHLEDIASIVKGFLAARKALDFTMVKSDDMSRAIGVNPDDYDRHTAMGDVLWTRDQWDVVMRDV